MSVAFANFSSLASNPYGWGRTEIKAYNFTYFWIIENFSQCSNEVDVSLDSPSFTVDTENLQTKWHLRLYPNMVKDDDCVGLFIIPVTKFKKKQMIRLTLSVLNVEMQRTEIKKCSDTDVCGKPDWGYKCFMKRTDLMSKAENLLPNDQLTICCDLTILTDPLTCYKRHHRSELKAKDRLSQDLSCLLESKMFSDVTLKVGEHEFHMHKALLAARSPVFAAMFQSEMRESKENTVVIDDIDKETITSVLQYIYMGHIPALHGTKQAQDILYATNKYALDELKMICEMDLSKIITTESAAEILVMADMHDAKFLKENATEYILAHSKEVIETEGWKLLEENQPKVASELFRATVARRLSKVDTATNK